jgi:subtilisin family serine protease
MMISRSLMRRVMTIGLAVVVAATVIATWGSAAVAASRDGTILPADGPTAVADSYIVVLKAGAATDLDTAANSLARPQGGSVVRTWNTIRGFEVAMSRSQAMKLVGNPAVAYVEQNQRVSLDAVQTPTPSWGLDRIDQRSLPLDNSYTYHATASNVTAYAIDTGIRISHSDFGGRATWGTNTIDGNNTDCNGHGTHTAGTIGGSTFGVAKAIHLVAVKVLDCGGAGTTASVISGVNWVTNNHPAGQPAVANMSLGGGFDQAINDAVTASINSGVVYGVAAGNADADACGVSPASTSTAITVGATDNTDTRPSFSDWGPCVHLFAPGVNITSDWATSDTATALDSGTSMATPHVVGVAALILSLNPTFTPAQVKSQLLAIATSGVVSDPGPGSPNRALFDDPAAGAAPRTSYAPVLASQNNRTVAVVTGTDGRVMYNWWDLGGAMNGWSEVPGGLHTNAAPAAAVVANGTYVFVLAKGLDGNVYLNQGTPGGRWVGWQSANIATNVAPTESSDGNRTFAAVTATDGRIMYTWWDLGGGMNGWREVPGSGHTDVAPSASLVDNGMYAFVMVKGLDGNVYLNQGTPGGSWVGWQPSYMATRVAVAQSSNGNRTAALVTGTDGRIRYQWWDLGGGSSVPTMLPGLVTDTTAGAGLVGNGTYLFVLAKTSDGSMWLNQGGPTTGSWVGWQPVT